MRKISPKGVKLRKLENLLKKNNNKKMQRYRKREQLALKVLN